MKYFLPICAFLHAFLCFATDSVPTKESSAKATQSLITWLRFGATNYLAVTNEPFAAVALTRQDAAGALAAIWQAHAEKIRNARASEIADKVIEVDGARMKFEMLAFTNNPSTNGQSLFISMHGGGGAPHRLNESQWRNQVQLGKMYHPSEGIYLAPRAPTDDWDLWHKAHIDACFDRLIQDLVVLSNVNPNRVYILGYSAGGDGVYQLAPRMADRFAAASMMAGHPNDCSPLGLRNLPFSIQVGADDGAYHRNDIAAQWGRKLDELEHDDPEGYKHFWELHQGKAHWMDLEDRKALPWMEKFSRNPRPDKIIWYQGNVPHRRFYWLAIQTGQPAKTDLIIATREGQNISLTSSNIHSVTVLLNDAMLNLDQPIHIRANGKLQTEVRHPRTIANLARTLADYGDTNLAFSAEATISLP